MFTRGVYNRDGEALGYFVGDRLYDPEGTWVGTRHGHTIYDRDGERRWLIDRDGVLDLQGQVIGYLGAPATHDV